MYLKLINKDKNLPESWKNYFESIGEEINIIASEINGPSWGPSKKKIDIDELQQKIDRKESETQKDDNTFSVSADFIKYNTRTPNHVKSSYFDENGNSFQPENEIYNRGNRGFNETDIKVGVLKLDYKHQFKEDLVFEGGVKGSLSKTENDARIEILQNDEFLNLRIFLETKL